MANSQIAQFVRNVTSAWFQPPKGMDAEAQRVQAQEMARGIASVFPAGTTDDEIARALDVAKSDLLRNAQSRAWPIIREVLDAVRAGLPRRSAAPDASGALAITLDNAEAWWRKFRDLPSWWNRWEIIEGLCARGVSAHDLWRSGVDVPPHLRTWPAAQRGEGVQPRRFGRIGE